MTKTNQMRDELRNTKLAFVDTLISFEALKREKTRKEILLRLAIEHYGIEREELKELILATWLDQCIKFPDIERGRLDQVKPVRNDLNEEN